MVLSNSKSMHTRIQNSEVSVSQSKVYKYSTFHSNRIKIQEILLILQLETGYFSSYLFQKWSMRSGGITVYIETSSSFIPFILHEEVQEILPVLILHSEDKELFE